MEKIKYLSKQFKALALVGALALTSTSFGCGPSTKEQPEETEITTEANEETTEVAEVINDNQKYYDEINATANDVVNFVNDSLAKGMFTLELTEENKEALAKQFLNYYLMLNKNELSGMSFSILNQDNDMVALDMINDSMISEQFIQEQAIVSESGTELKHENLFKNESDRKFIQDLASTVASMHTAVKNNDKESLDSLANHVIEIKNGLIEENASYSMTYEPMTIDLALMLIDSADMLYNGEIVKDDEDLAQILNTSFVRCVDGEYVSAMSDERIIALAAELEVEGYQTMTREQILEAISNLHHENVSEVSIRSSVRSISKALMAEVLTNTRIDEYNEEYSYKAIIKLIASQIDLSLQVIPTDTMKDIVNNNPNGANFYKGGDETGKTTVKKNVKPKDVPEDKRVEDKTTTNYDSNQTTEDADVVKDAQDSNDDYIKGKGAGITAGGVAASAQLKSTGKIPGTISAANAPSVSGSENYVKGYKEGYAEGWNAYVSSAKKSQSSKTTRTEKVKDSKEEKVTESAPRNIESTEKTTEAPTTEAPTTEAPTTDSNTIFVPIEGGEEEIIEESEVIDLSERQKLIEELKQQRTEINNLYAMYGESAKRM